MPRPASKSIIAVDIDDVLSNLAQELIDFSNRTWGTHLTIDDYDEHWGEMWKVDDAETKRRSDELHNAALASKLKHNLDARPVLEKLARKYTLVLATSRRRLITRETADWISKYFPKIFSGIHYSGIYDTNHHADIQTKITKADILKQIGASYLIDDQPKHCVAAADTGVIALLFGDYPWNRYAQLKPGIIRAKNWQEVLEYFDERS